VHVWLASIDYFITEIDQLWSLLSSAEIQRAKKYRFAADRNRYVIAHALLRLISSNYVQIAPDRLQFDNTVDKKPFLAEAHGSGIQFNLSHSGTFVLVAVAQDRQVGIDIEQIKPIQEMDLMSEQYFSAAEKACLHAAGPEDKLNQFFAYWTKKEAFIKAIGRGLSFPLSNLDISAVSDGSGFNYSDTSGDTSSWTFKDLPHVAGFKTSCVVEGNNPQVSCWQLTESNLSIFINKKDVLYEN